MADEKLREKAREFMRNALGKPLPAESVERAMDANLYGGWADVLVDFATPYVARAEAAEARAELLADVIAVLKLRLESHVKYIQTSEYGPKAEGYAAVLVPDWQVKQWIAEAASANGGQGDGSHN